MCFRPALIGGLNPPRGDPSPSAAGVEAEIVGPKLGPLAGLTAWELAALAKVDQSTISRMESAGHRPVRAMTGSLDSVVTALEAKGVVIESDGVRLRKPRR